MKVSKGAKLTIFVVLLLIIDQISKILVKSNMQIGESIHVFGDWFQILFVENIGMAFGMAFGGSIGKLILGICRIALVVLIFIYIRKLLRRDDTPCGVLFGLAAIMCGALGNIIDGVFYGVIFGYAPLFYGKVVDMLYFPLIDFVMPSKFPIWGGEHIIFFRPIFNIADSCITCGAIYLILFKWRFFSSANNDKITNQ